MGNRYRVFAKITAAVFAVAVVLPFAANAATVTSGSLTLGDPRPSQTTSYTFSASGFSTGTQIRCVQLRLNTAADGSGSTPTGLTTTSSTISSNTLVSGFAVDNTSSGSLRATSATLTAPSSSGTITWGNVTNGSAADTTYYGILTTHVLQNCSGAAVDTTVVAFIFKNGALVSLTVEPTLTFTIAAVSSGASVNGATTNITTTPTAIDFGNDVTASVKGVSAHDLQVATNATGGFSVHLRQTGNFTNGTTTITPWTGTNAAPTSFPAAGTLAWGYTTTDSSLAGGTANRFTSPTNRWAGMPSTNELVMDSTTSGSQSTTVGHQLGISNTTPAGNYSTTLVYTATGLY